MASRTLFVFLFLSQWMLAGTAYTHLPNHKDATAHRDSLNNDSTNFADLSASADTSIFFYSWDVNTVHVDSVNLSGMTDSIRLVLTTLRNPHFFLPIEGKVVSDFHWRTRSRHHNGLDISLNTGDTVYAAFDGVVRYAQYNTGGYGNLVVLRHYNMLETYYGHFSSILVIPGTYVKAGTPIGLGGSTGRSSGPHLHFEVRYLGNAIDPESVIDWNCGSLACNDLVLHSGLFKQKSVVATSTAATSAYHKVKSGETLYAISRRYGTPVNTICRLNGIRTTSTIRPGQRLRVK